MRLNTLPFAVACLGLLSACALGPRYVTPAPPPAAAGPFVSAEPAQAADQPLPPKWWRLYADRVLDRLVEQALSENQNLKVAAANLAYAEGLLDEARAGRFPTTGLSGGPSYGRTAFQAATGRTAKLTSAAGFTAGYQIDLFGRIARAIEAAKANTEAVRATQDAVRVTVAGETASAYANICGYGRQVAIARASVALVQRTYDIDAVERKAGALSDFDIARQGALLEQAKAAVPPLEGQRRVALFTLAALIGKTPAKVPGDAAGCVTPPRLTRALPVGDGAGLLRRRPDLRAAERQLASATARIGVAAADLYPTVTLGGSANLGPSQTVGGGNTTVFSYSVGPLVTWSFPNILVASARVRQARAQASSALAAFDASVLQSLREVEQALSLYAAELERHSALAAASDQADEAVRLAKIQSDAGAASFLDVLQVQATAVAANQAEAASAQAISADQVAVFQALGGGWEDAPPVSR